jgi:hypothetical protein
LLSLSVIDRNPFFAPPPPPRFLAPHPLSHFAFAVFTVGDQLQQPPCSRHGIADFARYLEEENYKLPIKEYEYM